MNYVRNAALVFMLAILAGCANQPSKGSNDSPGFMSLFSQKGSELSKLVDAKQFAEADSFLAKESAYFLKNKNDNLATLNRLSAGMTAIYAPKIEAALSKISGSRNTAPETWSVARSDLTQATALSEVVHKIEIFKEPSFEPRSLAALDSALATIKAEWKEKSGGAFKSYDHKSAKPFFANYPLNLDETSFFDTNYDLVRELVVSFNSEQLVGFAKTYAIPISKSVPLTELMASRYLETVMATAAKPASLVAVIDAVKRAKDAGFNPKSVPGVKIGFAEVTSKTLLKEGQIEFPAKITMDLPFDPTKAEIDDLLAGQDKSYPDFLIVFDVAKASTSRRILAKTEADSKFVSGTRTDPNPDYDVARGKYFEAQAGLANAQNTYAQGIAGAIVKAVAIGVWSSNVQTAESDLHSTPPSITRDITDGYKYSTSEVKANKVMTTNYYVIDRIAKKYYKGVFDTSESKSFKVSYNVHDKDPNRSQILSQYDKEEVIGRFEQAPMTVAASALIDDYLKNSSAAKPLPTVAKLRQEMLEDKNRALASFKAKQFDGAPLKDQRFDSVVVILNPKGALGSGFFVKPALVLTNYHVVEGVKFVEMKMFNGMETYGKVVKSDVRLDLALIKVQDQGVPVQFFEGNTIDLGATLEAIGHPKGLTFTITRGIASAVRKKKSVYDVGGKDVLFVQTDAAINPGNSGGPLFLGQQVVGVNNNKLAGGAEGLGFAVHYSEVAEFMKESF